MTLWEAVPQFCVINELKHSHSSSLRPLWRNTHISSPDPSQPSPASLHCSPMLCHRQLSSSCSLSSWVWDVWDSCSFFTFLLDYFTSLSLLHRLLSRRYSGSPAEESSWATLLQLCMSVAPQNSSTEEIYCCFFFFKDLKPPRVNVTENPASWIFNFSGSWRWWADSFLFCLIHFQFIKHQDVWPALITHTTCGDDLLRFSHICN